MRLTDLALRLLGSTSGEQIIRTAATASGAITLPAGTTDFTATGGAGQVVKQTSAGAAFTVAQLAASEVSGALTGNQTITLSGDITGSGATAITTTLPNVNPNVGTFASHTVNAKGLTTAAGNLTGDVTSSGAAATIAASAVTYAKIQNVANNRVLGNTSGSAAAPSEIVLPLSAANGGTGLAAGTSGGIPYYNTTATLASSTLLAANTLVMGGGAGLAPSSSPIATDASGNLACPGNAFLSSGAGTGDAAIELGYSRSGAGAAYIDLHAVASTDYEMRIRRESGVNGNASIINTGTGTLTLQQGSGTVSIAAAGGATLTGNVTATGYATRSGTAYDSHSFNINWTGSAILWVDNSNVGTITITSDYRIKENVAELQGTWEQVKALRPISYNIRDTEDGLFRRDPAERWGFIAHEIQEALTPTAATGYKDAPNVIQSPDLMTLLAATVGALQEAMARIEALETMT